MTRKSFTSDLEARNDSTPAAAAIADFVPKAKDKPAKPKKKEKAAKETKTKRVELLMRPSVYEALKERAEADGRSFNGYVNHALETILKEAGR